MNYTYKKEPAKFDIDIVSGKFLPANKVATTLAAQLSRMRLERHHLHEITKLGIPVQLRDGTEIKTEISA